MSRFTAEMGDIAKKAGVVLALAGAAFAAVYFWQRDRTEPPVLISSLEETTASHMAGMLSSMIGGDVGRMDPTTRSMSVPLSGFAYIVYRPIGADDIRVGMSLVFRGEGGRHTLHQVTALGSDNHFMTKGTGNARVDGWIPYNDIVGEYIGHVTFNPNPQPRK